MGLERPTVLTGEELRGLSDTALLQRVGEVDIFAEIEPNQKERILAALRKAGNVVGYLGDGINDAQRAPHRGRGDLGRERGGRRQGSGGHRAPGAGPRCPRAGRRGWAGSTFANTLKYVFITTSANFGNMVSMAGASLFLPFLPLLPKQILLNNFLSDVPSMTIATDTRGPRAGGSAAALGHPVHPELHDDVRAGQLGVRLPDVRRAALWLRATEPEFQTGWFVESLMTELVHRAGHPNPGAVLPEPARQTAARRHASRAGTTIFLPYTPLGRLFGFVPLPASVRPAAARDHRGIPRGERDGEGMVLPTIRLARLIPPG